MARVAADVTETLFSVFTGAELQLIGETLRGRVRELERRRDDNQRYAATLGDPGRRQFYEGWARKDGLEVEKLAAIIEKTPLW